MLFSEQITDTLSVHHDSLPHDPPSTVVIMDRSTTDEEAQSLLHSERSQKLSRQTSFPWFQFSILFLFQVSEHLTETVVYPFLPDLVRNLKITHGDEKNVGFYVGILQTAYHFAAMVTVFHCCQLSDLIGRRPVILTGLLGLSLCIGAFGLSTTFCALVLCKLLIGAFHGTTGVIKSVVVEITDSTHLARAWGYMMTSSFVAYTLGPLVGGSLSRPADQFPQLFGSSEFFKKYAYFLPCAVCAAFLFMTWTIAFVALKETREKQISLFPWLKQDITEDMQSQEVQEGDNGNIGPTKLLTPKVISAAIKYGALSVVVKAYYAIHPVFLSTPILDGGLGLTPRAIGNVSSITAIFTGLCQVFIFPRMQNTFGSRTVFLLGMLTSFPTIILWPVMNWIAKTGGYSGFLWSTLVLQGICVIVTHLSFGAVLTLIGESPRSHSSLGATMGFCQMVTNVVRAAGPAVFNSLFSLSVGNGYLGGQLVYVVTVCIAAIALYMASWSPHDNGR